MINKKGELLLIFVFLILLALPLVLAGSYGAGEYGSGLYGIGEVPPSDTGDGGGTGGGGGGGGGAGVECFKDIDCGYQRYCFQNKCHEAECFEDSECNVNQSEVCWNFRCAKLFDIKILDFESPIKLGSFFEFTYFAKGAAEINGDVEINFWIEQNGDIVTSGSDVVYFGSFEEKTETIKLFLPSDVESGTYEFYIQIVHQRYAAEAHRTVEISVSWRYNRYSS